jgi:branched-chain amino acid aminotransferase
VTINGRLVDPGEARVSVFDHGFLYGDAVYETLRTWHGRPFLLREHFARLGEAADALGIAVPWTLEGIRREIRTGLERAGGDGESLVRVILTRGVGALSPDPTTCESPTGILIVSPHLEYPPEMYSEGVPVAISARRRDPTIASLKTGNLIHQVLGARDSAARGVSEVIFLNSEGYLSDGTRSNIFFVRNQELLTPSKECGIVRGITRAMVIGIAGKLGIRVAEDQFLPDVIDGCQEAFLTSTTRGIMPVREIDLRSLGNGPGPLTARLTEAYRTEVRRLADTGDR